MCDHDRGPMPFWNSLPPRQKVALREVIRTYGGAHSAEEFDNATLAEMVDEALAIEEIFEGGA